MPEPRDLTVEVLKQIRDELVTTRTDLTGLVQETNQRLDQTNQRLDQTNARLTTVEATLVDLAEQQRFVVLHLTALTERDRRLEDGLDELRARVEVLEKTVGSG